MSAVELLNKVKNRRKIFSYFRETCDPEVKEVLKYMKRHFSLSMWNYPFDQRYAADDFSVYRDQTRGAFYVIHETRDGQSRKLYFKRSLDSETKVREYYRGIILEQDPDSPHRYEFDTLKADGKVIVDCGVAEGNFAIEFVEKAKHIYLLEPDPEWIEAINLTFAPWMDKITIISKFVGDKDDEESTTLDMVLRDCKEKIAYVKMDIEGYEAAAIKGMKHLKAKWEAEWESPEMFICVYHYWNEENDVRALFEPDIYRVDNTHGYALPLFENELKKPYFRRAMLRVKMKEKPKKGIE
jgi:hypothetical protein